jgi:hypothetical protein
MSDSQNDLSANEQTAAPVGRKLASFSNRIGQTYSTDDLRGIAAAIGVEIGAVEHQRKLLDVAAWWLRRDDAALKRTPPSQLRARVRSFILHLEKALKVLGVDDNDAAGDGPFDLELLTYLVQSADEDAVIGEVERIARLLAIVEAADALVDLRQRAETARDVVNRVGALIVPKGPFGDRAATEWVAGMLGIYTRITGSEIGTSISESGETGGPLIRFLIEAGRPLGIEMSGDAWRGRIRAILARRA